MVDLAPEGAQSLRDFFDAFTFWKWGTGDVIGELKLDERISSLPDERRRQHRAGLSKVTDCALAEAVGLFASGQLQALVILPDGSDRRYISQRAWAEAFFPERLFLDADVDAGHGSEFEAAVGRTLFVSSASVNGHFSSSRTKKAESQSSLALRDVLIGLVMDGVARPSEAEEFQRRWGLRAMQERPSGDQYDPEKRAAWTLPMVLSWMVFRNLGNVCEAMDDFRANWWTWVGVHRRLPLQGGAEWYDVRGAELRTLGPMTLTKLMLQEALECEQEYGGVTMSVKDARELLWSKLAEGALVATAIDAAGAVVQVPHHEWPYLELEADDKLMDRLVFSNGQHAQAYDKVTVRRSDVMSLWGGHPEPPDPPLMGYLAGQSVWTFLEAATWVGCKGKELPSKQVADEDLEQRGAYALFKALFPERGLVATGINKKRLREAIPAEYWEMATTNPEMARERHYLSFIDHVLRGHGGQLTPVGEDSPRWFGIRLDRDSMFEVFPEFVPKDMPATLPTAGIKRTPIRTPQRLEATCEALRELFPDGFPRGLAVKDRLKRINVWLIDNDRSEVSDSTLRRAMRAVYDDKA